MKKTTVLILLLLPFFLFSCIKDITYENYFDSKSYNSNYAAWKNKNLKDYTFTIVEFCEGYQIKVIIEIRNNEVVSKEYPVPNGERRPEEYLNDIKQDPLFGETNSIDDVFDCILKCYTDLVENPKPIKRYKSGEGVFSEIYYDAVHCNIKYDSQYHYPTYIEFERRYKQDHTDSVGFKNSFSYHIKDFKVLSDE